MNKNIDFTTLFSEVAGLDAVKDTIAVPLRFLDELSECPGNFQDLGFSMWETLCMLNGIIQDQWKIAAECIDKIAYMVCEGKLQTSADTLKMREVEVGRNEQHGIAWGYDVCDDGEKESEVTPSDSRGTEKSA